MALELRDYQRAAVDAVWDGMGEVDGNVLAVLPTGTGKALCIAELVRRAMQSYPETRILVLTHSRELVAQNFAEMLDLWPECPAGIYSAGLNKRDLHSRVIFGSIQSIHKRAYALQRIDIVIVDEAQTIPRNSDTTWRKFLSELLQINPFLRVVGWTATAFRLDSGMLHKGPDALFSEIVYEYNIIEAIEAGYLSPIISHAGHAQIDTSGVGTRGGEFIAGALEAAAVDPDIVEQIADEIVIAGQNRRGWIIFGCGIKHCGMLREALIARGISCEGVFATTPTAERDAIIKRFRKQEIRALVSVSALTTGFNVRHLDMVVLARPTKSCGLYIQMAGRGTRLFPGKVDCLIADFGGNIMRHGPVDAPRIKSPGTGEGGEMPSKNCPVCGAPNRIAACECVDCGAPFDVVGSKIETKASTAAVLSSHLSPEWIDVSEVSYSRHSKPGKPLSVQVTYRCGMVWHREWCCPEHDGYARQKFCQWWSKRAPACPVPNTVAEALANKSALAVPKRILVRPAGRFTEIVGVGF